MQHFLVPINLFWLNMLLLFNPFVVSGQVSTHFFLFRYFFLFGVDTIWRQRWFSTITILCSVWYRIDVGTPDVLYRCQPNVTVQHQTQKRHGVYTLYNNRLDDSTFTLRRGKTQKVISFYYRSIMFYCLNYSKLCNKNLKMKILKIAITGDIYSKLLQFLTLTTDLIFDEF